MTPLRELSGVAYTGAISGLASADRAAIMERKSELPDSPLRDRVAEIISRVRKSGDTALRELARELDSVQLDEIEVPPTACEKALREIPADLRVAMQRSARNIRAVHSANLPSAWEISPEPGIIVGRQPHPLETVGVYAPGGRASYPSSVLMGAIPARSAGVKNVFLASPPGADGLPPQGVLAAAALAEVDRVFAIGGAGAIAALAYGTETISRVDRIVGPGNAYVAEAKLQVSPVTGIDSPAGPSELLIIADEFASMQGIAAEMIAQAEHDPLSVVIALLVGPANANNLLNALEQLAIESPRSEIVRVALAKRGGVLLADSVDDAIAFSNEFSPEHLLLVLNNASSLLGKIRNAGAVFLGASSSVVFGDYMTGGNHVLPTGGQGRKYSGLSTLDFIRWTSYQSVTSEAACSLARDVSRFANAEGLPGHAAAAEMWGER